MAKRRKWTIEQLQVAVKESYSYRQVIDKLGLIAAGGNYAQLQKYIQEYNLDTSHFVGQGWRRGRTFETKPVIALEDILVKNSTFQSYKLKKRLFKAGLKIPKCEECGWCKQRDNGQIPVELDHINGDKYDNRLENLRILCPNCHSLKSTHRGRNIGKNKCRDGGIGRHATLKMS